MRQVHRRRLCPPASCSCGSAALGRRRARGVVEDLDEVRREGVRGDRAARLRVWGLPVGMTRRGASPVPVLARAEASP